MHLHNQRYGKPICIRLFADQAKATDIRYLPSPEHTSQSYYTQTMLNRFDHIVPKLLIAPNYRALRHVTIHIVVLLISINVFWDEPIYFLPQRLGSWLLYFILIDVIIYVNMYILVPKLLFRDRTSLYLTVTPLFILIMVLVIGWLQSGAQENGTEIITPVSIGIASAFLSFALFIAGLTSLQILKYRIENSSRIRELNTATKRIELANLKSQINPHFLFNMLNNAHFMVDEDSEKSSQLLTKLKDLLFYQIEEGSKESVSLKREIAFIKDYLELEKLRRDRFSYQIHLEGVTDIPIPPLLFIPFIENAVKHNPENDSYINLAIKLIGKTLLFECSNPKAKAEYKKGAGGIGLQNTKRRLDLLFGQHYQLQFKDLNNIFTITMKLSL